MELNFHLHRKKYSKKSTIGTLTIDGHLFKCVTLEDVCRDLNRDGDLKDPGEVKIFGETAIPAGRYELVLYKSPKFGLVPLLKNVDGFSYVEIHFGNYPKDSHGCILVAESAGIDVINNSRPIFKKLMEIFNAGIKKGKVYLTIHDLPMGVVAA